MEPGRRREELASLCAGEEAGQPGARAAVVLGLRSCSWVKAVTPDRKGRRITLNEKQKPKTKLCLKKHMCKVGSLTENIVGKK